MSQANALLAPSITKRLIEEFARQPESPEGIRELPAELTEREHEALELLAKGLSDREIATEI